MSRRDGIEKLLQGGAKVAPTVNDMKRAQATPEPEKPPVDSGNEVVQPKPRQKPAPSPKQPSRKAKPDRPKVDATPDDAVAVGQPIRIQISTSDGSKIAAALEEIRSNIPPAFRKNFNLGAYFRDVLLNNDAVVAKMIRDGKE